MDGPRACRIGELPGLRRLQNAVFRPDGGDMFEQYPSLYGEHNVDNLRIISDGEQVVSCVGLVERWALIEGCAISCALIGGVCTHSDYRNRGLATACLRDALAKARADDVDLALISGGRGLYLREGARPVGREWRATLDIAAADRCADASLSVANWHPDREMVEVAAVYRRELVRWLRPVDDFRYFAQSGYAVMRPCTIDVVRRGAPIVAYLVVSAPDEDHRLSLFEYAGERDAVAGAVAAAVRARGASTLAIDVLNGDQALRRRLLAAAVDLAPAAYHILLIVNFPSLMARLRPQLESELGVAAAARFVFREEPNEEGAPRVSVIERDGDEIIRLDRADMVRALFGDASENADSPPVDLSRVLPSGPLPLPQYGLNYV